MYQPKIRVKHPPAGHPCRLPITAGFRSRTRPKIIHSSCIAHHSTATFQKNTCGRVKMTSLDQTDGGKPLPASTKLRQLLSDPSKLLVCPGVYDGFSARIALSVGFDALYMVCDPCGQPVIHGNNQPHRRPAPAHPPPASAKPTSPSPPCLTCARTPK